MPDMYQEGDYDLAGFCVGVVDKKNLIDGKAIADGDVVIGIKSNGIHSNGYSLVRKIVYEAAGKKNDDSFNEHRTVADELLRPTTIYTKAIREVLTNYKVKSVVHGIVHVTGGGLEENIERVLPDGISVSIDGTSWERPEVFKWLQDLGGVETEEMFRVFNMGIGLVVIVSPFYADSVRRTLCQNDLDAWVIGSVASGKKSVTVSSK